MKKYLSAIVILLTVVSSFAFAQESKPATQAIPEHAYRDFSISLSPNLIFNTPYGTQFAGGLKMRMFVGKHFSFDSELLVGRNFTQFGPGLLGIPVWLVGLNNDSDEGTSLTELAILGVVILLSTEHSAYHIYLNGTTDLSPYISLLRFETTYRRGYLAVPDPNDFEASFGVGIELNKYFKRFVVSPYLEYNRSWSHHAFGANAGVYLGFYFPSRR